MAENNFSIVTFLPGIQFLQPLKFPLFGHCTSCEQRTSWVKNGKHKTGLESNKIIKFHKYDNLCWFVPELVAEFQQKNVKQIHSLAKHKKTSSRMSTGRPISQPGSKVMVDAKLSLGNLHLGYQKKTTATTTEDFKLDSWKDVFFTKKNTTSNFRESNKKSIQCTVDGWNPAPVDRYISLSQYSQGFIYPRWCKKRWVPRAEALRWSNERQMKQCLAPGWVLFVQLMGQNNPKQRVFSEGYNIYLLDVSNCSFGLVSFRLQG